MSAEVRLQGVEKRFGNVLAVRRINLDIAHGEFLTLLGPSGCGKTTTLRMVAGFTFPTSGDIYIGDERVTRVPPYRRSTGMVFQNYALFPHLTVEENVAFGLRIRGIPKAEIRRRVGAVLDLVGLSEFGGRLPRTLSGGQQQRVALARAVVIEPKVLLLDEPLGALDLKLREEMQLEIKRVQQELGITTLYVTHDQHEALSMSDRVAVMKEGRVLQVDTPGGLYKYPRSAFVANFIGRMNFLRVIVVEAGGQSGRATVCLRDDPSRTLVADHSRDLTFSRGEECVLAFRPEAALLDPLDALNVVDGCVQKVAYYGNSSLCFVETPGKDVLVIEVGSDGSVKRTGDKVRVGWKHCVVVKGSSEEPVPDSMATRKSVTAEA